MLFSIARTIESRDPNTGDHCDRLISLGHVFGEYLGLSPTHIQDLTWAGYLHDIGKVGIPDAVLLKTGPFTVAERTIMEQHVAIGEDICRPLRTMQGVLPIIRHHRDPSPRPRFSANRHFRCPHPRAPLQVSLLD